MPKKKKHSLWWVLAIQNEKGKWVPCYWAAKTKTLLKADSPWRIWPENNNCYRYMRLKVIEPK